MNIFRVALFEERSQCLFKYDQTGHDTVNTLRGAYLIGNSIGFEHNSGVN